MKRHVERPLGPAWVSTALQDLCPDCDRTLPVYQDDQRLVEGLNNAFWVHRRDKRCRKDCPGERPIFYAPRDLRIMLPGRIYGLDVTLYVGEHHLVDGVSLAQITRDLHARGVPLDQRHASRVFRDFLTLTMLDRGDDAALRARLCKQGGIVVMCDGVQFEDRSPVLYLVWDGISGEPLFGERKQYRGEADLVPLFERVRDMGVPVIGLVTDKEKGLVPAAQSVFPAVPYQFCQTHFLKNCAEPLQEDLSALQASVRRRADAVRKVDKRLASQASAATPPPRAAEAPVASVEAPIASVAEAPVASVAEAPVAPVAEASVATPVTSVAEAPVAPVAEASVATPVTSVVETPVASVAEAPVASVAEVPVASVAEAAEAPPPSLAQPPAHARDIGSPTHGPRQNLADRSQTTVAQAALTEHALVREVCEMVRVNSKMSGKAPLDPPELKRHERLEELRTFVDEARKKGAQTRPTAASGH